MFKHPKLVLNEAKPQEKQQSLAVTLEPETQASLGIAEHFHRGREMSPSFQTVLRLEDLPSTGKQTEAWKKMKSSISSFCPWMDRGMCVAELCCC